MKILPDQHLTTPGSSEESFSLQPDLLLASQVRAPRNILHRSEWLLLKALLSDALHVLTTFHPGRPGRSSKEKRQWETDLAWVRGETADPFSFVFVCEHLGLHPGSLRSHVERLITCPPADPQTLPGHAHHPDQAA